MPRCLSGTFTIMCTVGRGMEHLAAEEVAGLASSGVSVSQGRLYFDVTCKNIQSLLHLTLSERVFLCPLHTFVGSTTGQDSVTLAIKAALLSVELHLFALYISYWIDIRLGKSTEPSIVSDAVAAQPNSYEWSFKLMVKLRPKTLIKFTELVRKTACQLMGDRFNLHFCDDANLEINLMLSNNTLSIGLPLTSYRLSKRPYSVHIGLRSTTARAVVQNLEGDGLVLDPMCGKASLLCEAAAGFDCQSSKQPAVTPSQDGNLKRTNFTYFIGSDISLDQLMCASANFRRLQQDLLRSTIIWEVLLCDVSRLPFRFGVIDQLLCDLPFGRKYKLTVNSEETKVTSEGDFTSITNLWFQSMLRTLRPGASYSFLIPPFLRACLQNVMLKDENTQLKCITDKCIPVSLGRTDAVIISGRVSLCNLASGSHRDHDA